jgi:hypothetical protein
MTPRLFFFWNTNSRMHCHANFFVLNCSLGFIL